MKKSFNKNFLNSLTLYENHVSQTLCYYVLWDSKPGFDLSLFLILFGKKDSYLVSNKHLQQDKKTSEKISEKRLERVIRIKFGWFRNSIW